MVRRFAWRARGRWSGPVAAAGTVTWPLPAWATSIPATSSRWTGGVVAAMSSPHPAATPPATPTAGSPAGTWTPRLPRGASCPPAAAPASPGRPTHPGRLRPGGRPARTSLWAGGTRPGAGSGRHRPPRPAQPRLWEAARNLYNLVATGALDHQQVHEGLLQAAERCGLLADEPRQTHRTLASGRQIGLAHPRPAPAPHPPRPRPCFATPASPNRWRTDPGGEVRAMAAAGHQTG